MTAIALYHALPEQPATGVASLPPFPSEATGSSRSVSSFFRGKCGFSEVLEAILFGAEANPASAIPTVEVPAALKEIRDGLSLNTVQLAQALGVSRQAIYDWEDGKTVKEENRERITMLLRFAKKWLTLHDRPPGRSVVETIDGVSLLELLSQDALEPSHITGRMRALAERLRVAEARRPPSAAELKAKGFGAPVQRDDRRKVRSAMLAASRGRR